VQGAVRFSLGPETTDAEIEQVMAAVPRIVARLRQLGGGRR
jgi:cysteine sulfinate desulfinase/cysteine desulfurase-like protein